MWRDARGASLMEVLIAMMIISLLGVAIVGGLLVVRSTTDRTEAKANVLRQLSDAASTIALRPFVPCAATPSPLYASPAPLNPTVTVEVLDGTGAWVPCNGSGTTANSTVQRVTLSTVFQGKTFQRVMMKALP